MATINPFDLLGDDDSDDISQLIAKVPVVQPVAKPVQPVAKPVQPVAKPVQPAVKSLAKNPSPNQAGRDFKSEASRGGGRGGSRGGGRGRGGGRNFSRDSGINGYSGGYGGGAPEDGGGGYGPPRSSGGGRRGGSGDGEAAEGERPRRNYERHSGTGYGNEFKREGSGRGNWGTPTDEIAPVTDLPLNEEEKVVENEKEDANKETSGTEAVKKEVEEKEMTLEEYEKVLEEKRQALLASKPEERKVVLDKEFKSMQLLSSKKNAEEIFAKLGADKDKKKEVTEKVKKAVSINDFLKPAQGEGYYRPGGRGRGGRGGGGGNYRSNNVAAPSIQDVGQFPLLGVK